MQKSLTATQLAKGQSSFAQTKHQFSEDVRAQLRSEGIKEHANYHIAVTRSMTSRHVAHRRFGFMVMASVSFLAIAVMCLAFI